MTWIARAVAGWNRFWFTPQSAVIITAIRTMLGASAFLWAISLLPDLRTFYFDGGILPASSYRDSRMGLLQWWESDVGVTVVFCVLLASALALVFGVGVRVAAPLLWFSLLSMHQEAPSILNAGDLLLRIWAFYYAVFAVLTPSRFLSVPLLGARAPDGSRYWPVAPAWVLRVVQIQLTIIYVATIIEKIPGETWRNGKAAPLALGLVDFERFAVPDLFRENLFLGNLFTWLTIGLEVALPFLLWTKRTRRFAIVAGLSMHLVFDYTMRLGFFMGAMTIGYLSFVRPDELERVLRWRPRARRRQARVDDTAEVDGSADADAVAPEDAHTEAEDADSALVQL